MKRVILKPKASKMSKGNDTQNNPKNIEIHKPQKIKMSPMCSAGNDMPSRPPEDQF